MCYQINAWLERQDPFVEIIDKQRGEVILCLKGQVLAGLVETGILDGTVLASFNSDAEKQLIRDLLLYSCESPSIAEIAKGQAYVELSQL